MTTPAAEKGRGPSGWVVAFVAGVSAGTALLLGAAVAVFVAIGEPLRFDGLDAIGRVLQGALCLAWAGFWLWLRWRLQRSAARRAGLELLFLALAPAGLLFFAVPLPRDPWLVPPTVGLVAALVSLVPLTSFVARRELVARIGDAKTVSRLLGGLSPMLRAVRGVLLVAGAALCVAAAARPQLHEGTRMLSRRGIDVVVVLDFSKSMLARDVQPSRIDLAKRELDRFIQSLGGDRIGLVAFAGEAVQFPLTTDYEAATLFWRDLDPYDMPVGGTAIGRALTTAVRLFESDRLAAERSKVIVLLTDGEDHEGDPVEVARQAAQADITIHVLGIGGRAPELIPQHVGDGSWSGFQRDGEGEYITTALTEENEEQLRQIAHVTGGEYFRAEPGQVGVERIQREIRRLRQTQLEERRVRLYGEAYQYFLLFGLLFLVAATVLPRGLPNRAAGGRALAPGGGVP
jgi:Ca-activated chloride channel family protein